MNPASQIAFAELEILAKAGTSLILLANPHSHFPLQKPIYIMGDTRLKTLDCR